MKGRRRKGIWVVERALAPELAEKASAEDHSEWVIWRSQCRGLEDGVETERKRAYIEFIGTFSHGCRLL